jgi:hypothetical protein
MFKHSKSDHVNFARIYDLASNTLEKKVLVELPVIKKIVERKKRENRIILMMKYFNIGAILLFLVFLGIAGLNIKNFQKIYSLSASGKGNLEVAILNMKNQKYETALELSESAEKDFAAALDILNAYGNNFIIKNSYYLHSQIQSASYLLATVEILARAANEGARFGADFNRIIDYSKTNMASLSDEEKRSILKFVYENIPELYGLKANIDLAWMNFEKINFTGPLKPIEGELKDLRANLYDTRILLEKTLPMAELMPALLGYPGKSSFLVILHNQDELRPTGGFIGTYGIMINKDGNIERLETHDIYHMDMPVKDFVNVEPPEPIKKYLVDKWYMRDANWSPDWPESAKQIEWFYKLEDKLLPPKDQINNFEGEFNGVIGITPDFIISFLDITGPVHLEGDEFNKDNFMELLEYKVEREYVQLGISSWHRKEIIGDIMEILKKRVFDEFQISIGDTFNLMIDSLAKKDLVIYHKDRHLQDILYDMNWSGDVRKTDGDYFLVVDSNMASYKTDSVMNRNITYEVKESLNGLFSDLRIDYSHTGSYDWRTTKYRTYTRIYAPLGSELLDAKGYTDGKVDVYEELGKTVFGMFIDIEPGKIGNLHLKYKLPQKLANDLKNGKYSLYAQKQPGKKIDSLIVDLNFQNDIRLYHPSGLYTEKLTNQRVKWDNGFKTDRVFRVNF